MTNKTTYVSALSTAIENPSALSAEEVAKLTALRESLIKRNATKSTKPTKSQVENAGFKTAIAEYLSMVEGGKTIAEINKGCKAVAELSSQRLSAIVTQMVNAGTVVRTVEKRKAYFSLA